MSAVQGTTVETTTLEAPGELELAAGAASRRAAALERRLIALPWALPAIDFLALVGAFACAVAWTPGAQGLFPLVVFPLLSVVSMSVRGAYAPRLRLVVLDSFGLAAGSVSVAAMCTLAFGLLLRSGDPGSGLLFRAWLLGVVCIGATRVVFALEAQRLRASGATARRTVIVGAGEVGARIARRLEQSPAYGLLPIGFLDADPPAPEAVGGRRAPVLGGPGDLTALVESERVDHVILAFSGVADRALLPLVRCCTARSVGVSIVPRFFDSINNRLAYEPVGGLPIATLRVHESPGTDVCAQARNRPGPRRGAARAPGAAAGRHRRPREAQLAGSRAVPPASRRPRRAGLRHAQVPDDGADRRQRRRSSLPAAWRRAASRA